MQFDTFWVDNINLLHVFATAMSYSTYAYAEAFPDMKAGDFRIVEMGHSKEYEDTNIFNYAIAYDMANREQLFYGLYPGSINDISQFH